MGGRYGVPAQKVEYWDRHAQSIEGAALYVFLFQSGRPRPGKHSRSCSGEGWGGVLPSSRGPRDGGSSVYGE